MLGEKRRGEFDAWRTGTLPSDGLCLTGVLSFGQKAVRREAKRRQDVSLMERKVNVSLGYLALLFNGNWRYSLAHTETHSPDVSSEGQETDKARLAFIMVNIASWLDRGDKLFTAFIQSNVRYGAGQMGLRSRNQSMSMSTCAAFC